MCVGGRGKGGPEGSEPGAGRLGRGLAGAGAELPQGRVRGAGLPVVGPRGSGRGGCVRAAGRAEGSAIPGKAGDPRRPPREGGVPVLGGDSELGLSGFLRGS